MFERVNRQQRSDLDVIGGTLSLACYIEHSCPAVLYLAARYANDFESAMVANTNVGGDNCHRGAVLGVLLGAALGYAAIPERWIRGLCSRAELEQEIESFIERAEGRGWHWLSERKSLSHQHHCQPRAEPVRSSKGPGLKAEGLRVALAERA